MSASANHYFIVGIKGVAMASIAVILKQMGHTVTGSDTADTQPTDSLLQENEIAYTQGFLARDLSKNIDKVIYAASHGGEKNPQVVEARTRNIPVIHQAIFLGELLSQFPHSLAVCGCHGKTTTASLLATALHNLGSHPSWLVGTPSFGDLPGGMYQKGDYFVVEADEYAIDPPTNKKPKLLFLHPQYALCLNIDYDHPDVYDNIEDTKHTFASFFKQTNKMVFLCTEDGPSMSVADSLANGTYQTYGFSPHADLWVRKIRSDEHQTFFHLTHHGTDLGEWKIKLYGEKNVLNASGVILMLLTLGFPPQKIQKAIEQFSGAKRRFEHIQTVDNTLLFDDYGHHPHEVEATIQAAHARFPNRRLILIFQPHTFSRTAEMKQEFAEVLSQADVAIIAPIFGSAREQFQGSISSADIEACVPTNKRKTVHACTSLDAVLVTLRDTMKQGDVIFTMGAGDIYKIAPKIITIMEKK